MPIDVGLHLVMAAFALGTNVWPDPCPGVVSPPAAVFGDVPRQYSDDLAARVRFRRRFITKVAFEVN